MVLPSPNAHITFSNRHFKAMAINVGAVFSVIELAKKMKNLKALIHVSTAYCNTHLPW